MLNPLTAIHYEGRFLQEPVNGLLQVCGELLVAFPTPHSLLPTPGSQRTNERCERSIKSSISFTSGALSAARASSARASDSGSPELYRVR